MTAAAGHRAARAYELGFAGVVALVLVVQAARLARQPIASALAGLSPSGAAAVAVAGALVALGAWILAVHFAGPVGLGRAAQRWRVPPAGAAGWVGGLTRRRRILVFAAAALASAWLGLMLPIAVPAALACAAGAFAAFAAAGHLAVLAQHHDMAASVQASGLLLLAAGLAIFYAATAAVGIPGLIVAVGYGVFASRRRGSRRRTRAAIPPRWELARGAEGLAAVSASVVAMDGRAWANLRYSRAGSALARLRLPRSLGPAARVALISARRSLLAGRVIRHLAWAGLPAACLTLGMGRLAPAIALVIVVLFSVSASSALDRWFDAPALRRTLPVTRGSGTLALAGPVAAATLVFAAAAVLLAGLDPLWIAAAAVTAACAHLRRWSARRRPEAFGPFLMTDAGAVPLGLLSRVTAGVDVALLGAVLALLAPAGLIVAAMSLVGAGYAGWLVLRR